MEPAGLGESGEVYIVSAFNDFVSSERFGRAGHRRGVHSEGVSRAVSGLSGVGLYDNYRDAITWWSWRRFWSPRC